MKCPQCGKWNRASFPTCQFCGAALNHEAGEEPSWRATLKDDQRGKEYIRVDEAGQAETTPDARDVLAQEMSELKVRKAAGREQQRRLRAEGARRGAAPSGMTVRTRATGDDFWQLGDDPKTTVRIARPQQEPDVATDDPYASSRTRRVSPPGAGQEDSRSYDPLWNDTEFSATWQLPPVQPTSSFTAKLPSRRRGMRHLIRALTILLVAGLVGLTGFFGYEYFKDRQATRAEQRPGGGLHQG